MSSATDVVEAAAKDLGSEVEVVQVRSEGRGVGSEVAVDVEARDVFRDGGSS